MQSRRGKSQSQEEPIGVRGGTARCPDETWRKNFEQIHKDINNLAVYEKKDYTYSDLMEKMGFIQPGELPEEDADNNEDKDEAGNNSSIQEAGHDPAASIKQQLIEITEQNKRLSEDTLLRKDDGGPAAPSKKAAFGATFQDELRDMAARAVPAGMDQTPRTLHSPKDRP